MALQKQRRLQTAALTTGYTINTLGEGKASRAETNVRAVVIRAPHHASPAEDKVRGPVVLAWACSPTDLFISLARCVCVCMW